MKTQVDIIIWLNYSSSQKRGKSFNLCGYILGLDRLLHDITVKESLVYSEILK